MQDHPHNDELQIVRRALLIGGAAIPLGLGAASSVTEASAQPAHNSAIPTNARSISMNTITTRDGVSLYVKDWGPRGGQPVVLSHGWPLNADSWESQALHLAGHGYRVVAHDRRGHGRSGQPWDGNDMDHYADDLAQVIEALDLRNIAVFGFSTGGGEVTRYVGRHGTGRVAKIGLISAVPPLMLRTAANPEGQPIEVFDGLRAASIADRSKLYLDIASGPFFGFNRPGAEPSQGMIQSFWLQGMMVGHKNAYDCIKAFSETDFTEDLKRFDRPTLLVHGSDDQVVPIGPAARAAKRLVPHAELKVYAGAPHGLGDTHKQQLNADLLAFLRG
jgi:non-heme chloroperoxidase